MDWHIEHGLVKPFDWDAPEPEPEPVVTAEELLSKRELEAKAERERCIGDVLVMAELDGATFQCANDAENLRKVISDADAVGSAEDEETLFRLADNSWRQTSLAELRLVLQAHILRKQEVWAQFGVWDNGDKLESFVYVAP